MCSSEVGDPPSETFASTSWSSERAGRAPPFTVTFTVARRFGGAIGSDSPRVEPSEPTTRTTSRFSDCSSEGSASIRSRYWPSASRSPLAARTSPRAVRQ